MTPADRFSLVVFDMDGVLIDSASIHRRAYACLWERLGLTGPRYEALAGLRTRDVVRQHTLCLNPDAAQLDSWVRFKQQRALALFETARLDYEDTLPALRRLARTGLRRGVATGASRERTHAVLRRLGLGGYFCPVLTADDVPVSKPSPAIYLEAMRRAGSTGDATLVVEDSRAGVEAGLGAGAWTASVRSGEQADSPRFVGAWDDLGDLVTGLGLA